MSKGILGILAVVLITSAIVFIRLSGSAQNTANDANFTPPETQQNQTSPTTHSSNRPSDPVQVIAQNVQIPWGVGFLPNGDLLVTQREGTLLKVGHDTQVIEQISGVEHVGEGGLMGLALHPDFEQNQQLYLYLTTRSATGLTNRVERYQLNDNQLSNREVIIENIPGAANHDGGRIAFGPDNNLYITTGDAGNPNLSQDTTSLAGKILRLQADGSIPSDNPFNNAVWSYGHRNPQGLTWDDQGQLWATEHGPSGLQSGCDELNRIERGGNYGWPLVRCEQTEAGMISPVLQSGRDETWAPSGAAYYNGSIFFAGLRGSTLYQATISTNEVTAFNEHFKNEFGRLRTVFLSPENLLILTTSNTDGRGQPNEGDDVILRIDPEAL